jgi:hypothetical protein
VLSFAMPRHTPRGPAHEGTPSFATPRNHGPCDDCQVEDRIDGMGKPRKGRAPWSGPPRLVKTSERGCETCGGTGVVPLEGIARLDPYMISKKG